MQAYNQGLGVLYVKNPGYRNLLISIILSICLHLIFLYYLIFSSHLQSLPPENVLEVSLEQNENKLNNLLKKEQDQIVNTETSNDNDVEKETKYISDKNNNTKVETVKRGEDEKFTAKQKNSSTKSTTVQNIPQKNITTITKITKSEQKTISSKTESKKLSLSDLKLDNNTLTKTLNITKSSTEQKNKNPDFKESLDSLLRKSDASASIYRPFSRPSGTGAAFYSGGGTSGTPDFLPNLPDGDLTLLNAKADKYATFVRRVALQVFSAIRKNGWENLQEKDINQINDYSTYKAIMDLSGNLVKVIPVTNSGSNGFNRIVYTSINEGVKDSNPPKDAVSDNGNIVFIFRSKTWSGTGVAGRTGALFERRWLLLETGLE